MRKIAMFFILLMVLITMPSLMASNEYPFATIYTENNPSVELVLTNNDRLNLVMSKNKDTLTLIKNLSSNEQLKIGQLETVFFDIDYYSVLTINGNLPVFFSAGYATLDLDMNGRVKITHYPASGGSLVLFMGELNDSTQGHVYRLNLDYLYPEILLDTTHFINSIGSNETLADIFAAINLKGLDYNKLDITDQIVVERDDFSANYLKVGSFLVSLSLINDLGIKTNKHLYITNIDNDAPIVNIPPMTTISYLMTLDIENYVSSFYLKDNSEDEITFSITYNNYAPNMPGEYLVKFAVADASQNTNYYEHQIMVVDDVAPIITNQGPIDLVVKKGTLITKELLLEGIIGSDEVDGNLTKDIKILNSVSGELIGEFVIEYELSDKAGNVTNYQRKLVVNSALFEGVTSQGTTITISNGEIYSEAQLILLVAEQNHINIVSFNVIKNEYLNNEKNRGNYQFLIEVITADKGKIILDQQIVVLTNYEELKSDVAIEIYEEEEIDYQMWIIIGLAMIIVGIGLIWFVKRRRA